MEIITINLPLPSMTFTSPPINDIVVVTPPAFDNVDNALVVLLLLLFAVEEFDVATECVNAAPPWIGVVTFDDLVDEAAAATCAAVPNRLTV